MDNPATTLALLKLNAVVGLKGTSNKDGSLKSIGITCALCHSTVDNSFSPGIGVRLDGWPNRDLNVGVIISLAPDLSPVTGLLGVDEKTLKQVLAGWGPGKFDAVVFMDGKEHSYQVRPIIQPKLATLSKGDAAVILVDEENKVTDVAFMPGGTK
jgi:hypothetical protein